jgi:hypothetical protein
MSVTNEELIRLRDAGKITFNKQVHLIVTELLERREDQRDLVHSEEFVVMFLGYLCGDIPELHAVECPKFLETWQKFKQEMGKTA